VVEEWIVVEADSTAFHSGDAIPRDYRRDAALAATGRTPIRFGYAQVVYDLPSVARALIGIVASHRRVRNSGQKALRATRRLRTLGLA
jgi:very-short-patch-repair endonuclease